MRTIARNVRVEQVIEKSRFICTLRKVSSEEEAQAFIKEIKKEFWDATHNCSAYLVDDRSQRSSDDGEPSGTAGVPMLGVLQSRELTGTAAVVTRYFGGIKLGAGGLVRAYSGSVAQAVEEAGLAEIIPVGDYTFHCGMAESGKIMNLLFQQDIFQIADTLYGTEVTFLLRMPERRKEEAEAWLTDTLQRETELEKVGGSLEECPI